MKRLRPHGDKTAAMLADLVDTVAVQLVERCALDADAARGVGEDAKQRLCLAWMGPTHFYFPRGRHLDTRERAMAMLDRFRGDNHAQLAEEFDTTEINVYRIVKKYAREHARATHTDLFKGTDHAPPETEKPEGVETLDQFTAVIEQALQAADVPAAAAQAIAVCIRDKMRRRWGGKQIHISKDSVIPSGIDGGYHVADLFDGMR